MTILRAFAPQAFQSIEFQDQCAKQLLECGLRSIPSEFADFLIHTLTLDELWKAVAQGKPRKTPVTDGICLEFYRAAWDVIKDDLLQIMNSIFLNGLILDRQVQGQILCIPKKARPTTTGDYRALTLLNVDYKILTRAIANRLKPTLPKTMHPQQHCGVPGTTVFDAVATIQDAIAYADFKKAPLCVVSLDFHTAFDKISHAYLQDILRAYGFGKLFVDRIMGLYRNATSEVQINGFRSHPIPIRRSLRQG
jgi:hypothetical protein